MPPLLEAKNLTKVFGSGDNVTVALNNFSLTVSGETPSFTSIAGESGSGKTTLARILLGFSQPTSGEILYRGKSLWKMSGSEWLKFRQDVQAVFQDPFEVFNPFYRVDHLLTTPISKFHLARSKAEARHQMEEALNAVGLRPEETLGRYPHQLSGGQRQRLTIARALLLHPKLIIADEPVSMVDASLRATILESLRKLHTDFGISFLYITHDLTTAYQISEDIIVLYRGSVAEVGDVEQIVQEPQHPYTRLLVGSIPLPDPEVTWEKEKRAGGSAGGPSDGRVGCRFADRCPHVMAICREKAPPLFKTANHRAAACYLYREHPPLPGSQMNEVMAGFPR